MVCNVTLSYFRLSHPLSVFLAYLGSMSMNESCRAQNGHLRDERFARKMNKPKGGGRNDRG